MWNDGYGWQFGWIWPLVMLAMFGGMVFLIRRRLGDGPHHWGPPWHNPGHTALQILNERFARGEIARDEYEEKRATIFSGGQH